MSSSSIDNLDRPHEEAKNESEAGSYDSIDDEFLRTAFNNRIDDPQNLDPDRDKDIEATFIIGESGSGKSTLASLLENSRLTAEFDGTCWLFSGDENSKAVIGNTPSCCTELPTRIEGKNDKSVYYDFPGFFDNRDSKEIACSFYLQTLINQTKTFRIILTVDYHMFQCGRSKALIDLVDYMQGLFPDIDLLLKALFVVVTKVPEVGTIEAIQAKVKEYVKHTKRLSPRISSILMWLSDARQSARIELFRQPSKSGEIDNTTLQNILTKLGNVSFMEKGSIKLYVPKHTKYYVNKLVERLQNKMNIEVLKMIQKIEEICQRMIENSSFKELSDFIISVKDHILENCQGNKTSGEFLFMLSYYAEKINRLRSSPIEPLNLETLKKTEDSMVTLKRILPDTQFNVTLWCYQFRALKDRISKIINFDYTEEKGDLKIKGIAINANQLEPLLKEGLKSVEIHCFGAIFFDKVNILCKGVNIAIIAPVWRVNGTNIIDISGNEGLPFTQREFNFDGHPGNPGGNAGNFLGICEKYVWDGELKIIANGGKGGRGEDGLDEYKNLENMIETLRIKKPKAELKKPGPEPEPANPKPNEIESQPQKNRKRSGKGGCGGYGGNPGRVKISNETENILKIIIEKKRGEVGDNGSPGLKMERREELTLLKNEGKDKKEPVPMYLTALQRCCGLINISDDPRPRQRSYSVRLTTGIDSVTQLSSSARLGNQGNSRRIASSPEEINTENLMEPSPNDFQFNEGIIKETHKGYFNKVVKEEGLQEIIEKNLFHIEK